MENIMTSNDEERELSDVEVDSAEDEHSDSKVEFHRDNTLWDKVLPRLEVSVEFTVKRCEASNKVYTVKGVYVADRVTARDITRPATKTRNTSLQGQLRNSIVKMQGDPETNFAAAVAKMQGFVRNIVPAERGEGGRSRIEAARAEGRGQMNLMIKRGMEMIESGKPLSRAEYTDFQVLIPVLTRAGAKWTE
jgi:hypothetical protein